MLSVRRGLLVVLFGLAITGCPPVDQPPDDGGGGGSGDGGTGGDVSASALSYLGSVSGTAETVSSTADSEGGQAARRRPIRASAAAQTVQITSAAVGWLTDLNGNRLKDADGNEYPDFAVGTDGSFDVQGLPVGVDIVLHVDVDGDGDADLTTIINIPKDADADTGSLDGTPNDPLSTLVFARFRRLAAAHGVNPSNLGISPSALIQRIRDAYIHLFEDAGIEKEITLQDILDLSEEQLAALFDLVVPPSARRGMEMAEGNAALVLADDVEGVVKAAARILVQGGFAIADDPGGADLSFLATLPHVQAFTFEQFNQLMQSMGPEGGPPPGQDVPFDHQPTIYMSELGEVDRNFVNNEDEGGDRGPGPMFGEHMLSRMAEQFLDGKTISLSNLYELVVDLELGMGARLFYSRWNGPGEPPTEVFESADGTGVELNLFEFFQRLDSLRLDDPNPELFEQKQAELRQLAAEFLADTVEPSFARLFGGILMDRVGSAEEFAARIRAARAHLPFSRSGPASFYVVATADSFMDDSAQPVTVDIETNDSGRLTKVTYNAAGEGKFYVGFGPMSDSGMLVFLINRQTGRPLHDHEGMHQEVELSDTSIFQSVGGQSFIEAFSETGTHYPGAPALRVPNPDFDPALPPDPETNPPAFEAYVLMTAPGPDADPVRVNYADGVATYDESGRYYLMFDEHTQDDGLFALITDTGEVLQTVPWDWTTRVLVAATSVQGIDLAPEVFTHIFGIDAPNQGYDASGDPYYDDINNNGQPDDGEPTFTWREFLFDPSDWRSTRVEHYYRRADNNGFPEMQDIDWEADTPRMRDGVALVPRNLKPRLNAFRFGRPNVTINLLAAFAPPEFFDGTHALNADTRVNPFMAVAILNLVFDSIHNVQAVIDFDGSGPAPAQAELIDAHVFMMPIGDPLQMISDGFAALAE